MTIKNTEEGTDANDVLQQRWSSKVRTQFSAIIKPPPSSRTAI